MKGWRTVHSGNDPASKKEGTPAVCDNRGEPGEHYAK